MKIWLDTTDVEFVKHASRLGIVAGVTTNPSLISKSPLSLTNIIEGLLEAQSGPITVQVVSNKAQEMVQQGLDFFSKSNRIIIKIPMTEEGLEAIHILSSRGIPTMATALFSARQALIAASAGVDYIAPYLGRMENAGINPWDTLNSIMKTLNSLPKKVSILAASLKSADQVVKCAEIGIAGVTLKKEIYDSLVADDPLTNQSVQQFADDWNSKFVI